MELNDYYIKFNQNTSRNQLEHSRVPTDGSNVFLCRNLTIVWCLAKMSHSCQTSSQMFQGRAFMKLARSLTNFPRHLTSQDELGLRCLWTFDGVESLF